MTQTRPNWRKRILLLALGLALGALAYYVPHIFVAQQLYRQNLHAHVALGAMPPPTAHDRVLVFSPHEDDDVLGCGGYMQQAVAAGAKVSVVFMTNGDYLLTLNKYTTRSVPQASLQYGYQRQQESLAADKMLGVPGSAITFLGYPNGPLYRMWLPEHWFPNAPASSEKTLCTRSPYTNSFTPGAIHCGSSVVRDIETIMRREKPTVIISLHPNEINADHWATGCYVNFALNELRAQGVPFAKTCKVYTYIIHRQHWPAPMSYLPYQPLIPPASLISEGRTNWLSLPLTPAQTQLKHAALGLFKSQHAYYSPIIRTFARRNEIFGQITDRQWPTGANVPLHTVIVDPPADSDETVFNAHADLVKVEMGREGNQLVIRATMRGTVTPDITSNLSIHAGGATTDSRRLLQFAWHGTHAEGMQSVQDSLQPLHNLAAETSGNTMTLHAPWPFTDNGPQRQTFFMVHAWTTVRGHIVNQTMTETVRL